jgi:DNA-3-methyladenine glycosylase
MLPISFFQRDVLTVARELIGVELVWHGCSGIIVETEAYAVEGDEACHTASRPSTREFVKAMPPGAAYVYLNYGMYWLFNLLVKGGERDGLILVRALEPSSGIEEMKRRRKKERAEELCSGPGKLAMALGITGEHHGTPMAGRCRPRDVGLRKPRARPGHEIVEDVRVGISKAADHPWRFLSKGHAHVSVPHGKVKVAGRSGK